MGFFEAFPYFVRSVIPEYTVIYAKSKKPRLIIVFVNNGNKHLIVAADVRSEYSNIRYLHLIIGKAQKFVSGDKYDF